MNWCAVRLMLKQTLCFIGKILIWFSGLWVGVWIPFSWAAHKWFLLPGSNGTKVDWFGAFYGVLIFPTLGTLMFIYISIHLYNWYDDCVHYCGSSERQREK